MYDMRLDRRDFLAVALAAAPTLVGRPSLAAGRPPLAIVTADREARVVVVSLATHRVVAHVATVEDPRSIQSAPGGRAVVGHAGAGAVTLLEGRPLRVRRVLRGFGAPRYTAVHPRDELAYVSDGDHGELAVVDLRAARVVTRVTVGAGARHLTVDPAGSTLWVALGSSAESIVVVDIREPRRPRVARAIRPPFLAHDVGFSPSGRRVWVTAGREPRLAIFARDGRTPLRQLPADAAPQHVTFGPGFAYVASGNAGSVRTHALADGRDVATARVPTGSYNVQRTGASVVTPSLGTGSLTVLSARGRVAASLDVAVAAHDACIV